MMNSTTGYIFDLDGTLYDFGGVSFSRSLLGKAMREKYISLIENTEDKSAQEQYEDMCEIEKQTGIGVSIQFAQKLNITRNEVLEKTWGTIDPRAIIYYYQYSPIVLSKLQRANKRLFLVTAAPKIWAYKALKYMKLTDYFELIFGLEDFKETKKEIFQKITLETGINPQNIVSIGDQYESDIIPAQELGMKTHLIRNQDDLFRLFTP